jgi:perosamine synthetase
VTFSLGYNAVPVSAKKLVLEVFESGQFSPGARVREFEEKFARLHKAKHAVFVNSGTDALRLSLLALKEKCSWGEGSEVAVPALTFVATVNVILQAGLKPFFVDVSMYDYLLNPANLEHRLKTGHAKLVAMMPVHIFGQSCGEEVFAMAKKYKLKVIEDSCETILNPIRGDVSCYSTYMAHHVTTGVGGMALTNDGWLNLLMRSYANHGRNEDYLPGYKAFSDIRARFKFDRIGYSSRATEFEAVLGLSQLDGLKKNVLKRREIFIGLLDALGSFDELNFVGVTDNTCMMFPVVIREDYKIEKYDLCLVLEKAGIETRDMMPITNQPCYKGLVNEDSFPVAKWVNKKGFYLPCNPGMTKSDVEHIVGVFKKFLH